MYEIEKGVPLPAHGNARYPFRDMAVGDSFVSDRNISAAVSEAGKRLGLKFICRKQPDGSFRVWRVA